MPALDDFAYALRALRRSPAFTAVAVLSLALGIGANAAIFSLMDQAILRFLPVKDPKQLLLLDWEGGNFCCSYRGPHTFAYPTYVDLRNGQPGVFTGLAAQYQDVADVAAGGLAQRASVELVSGNYFQVLGVGPELGRMLTPDDDKVKGAEPYVVLSYGYWTRRFGADASILNKAIRVNNHPMTVVGVAPKGFKGIDAVSPVDLFVPMMMKAQITPTWDDLARRTSVWLNIFGRLKPGVNVERARAAAEVVYRQALVEDLTELPDAGPEFKKGYNRRSFTLHPLAQGLSGIDSPLLTPIVVLLCMVGTLLLIACVNLANLLVARAANRNREIAVRLSLGATRVRLFRLMMAESLVLSLAGGALALLVAAWTSAFLVQLAPPSLLPAGAMATTPDWRVLLFTFALCLLTALLFGCGPSLQASRTDVASMLTGEARTVSAGRGQVRLRRGLMAAQVALSVLLLAGAGLFVRSLRNVFAVDPGLRIDKMLTFSIDPSLQGYQPDRARRLFSDLQDNLQKIPGVVSASGATFPVLAGYRDEGTLEVEGYSAKKEENMQAGWDQVLPGFFSTMQIPLVAGREFTARDTGASPEIVVVNETFVKRFFPHSNPIGRRTGFLKLGWEIVGVVKDAKSDNMKQEPMPWVYTPGLEDPQPGAMHFYLQTKADPLSLAPAARAIVHRFDPSLPVVDVKTLEMQISETHAVDRLFAMLSAAFGLLATLLASIGLYGLTTYTVTRRTREIGIRIALGAERRNILWIVMQEVLLLTAIGLGIGIPASLALGRFVQDLLFEMQARDPLVLAVAAGTIIAVSLSAGYLPARRATAVDPVHALHYE